MARNHILLPYLLFCERIEQGQLQYEQDALNKSIDEAEIEAYLVCGCSKTYRRLQMLQL